MDFSHIGPTDAVEESRRRRDSCRAYSMQKSSFFHVLSNFVVMFYFSHYCFVFPLTLLSFIQLCLFVNKSRPLKNYALVRARAT